MPKTNHGAIVVEISPPADPFAALTHVEVRRPGDDPYSCHCLLELETIDGEPHMHVRWQEAEPPEPLRDALFAATQAWLQSLLPEHDVIHGEPPKGTP